MQCPACGNPIQGAFCSHCGAPAAPPAYTAPPPNAYAPPPPAYGVPFPGRVQRHLQILGILWLVYGAYRGLTGIIGAAVLTGLSHGALQNWSAPPTFPYGTGAHWMAGLAAVVAAFTFFSTILSFLVGYALLNRKPWARTLAIVIGILQLIHIPFGTALGIYTLWVFGCSRSAAEYEALANHT
ncbi:MAG TPA: hypothetical protein VGU46_09675 [Acidobacteriaceae bacterium]|nr:hypothetical protein [Acidobacteriaceae bacterium]